MAENVAGIREEKKVAHLFSELSRCVPFYQKLLERQAALIAAL